MRIGIIDADLVGRDRHRFPNLACMKLSAYHKLRGDEVTLLTSYDEVDSYDTVFISKAFTDTEVPEGVLEKDNVSYGGTGFFYDKAEPLPEHIEHIFPDYNLYSDWVDKKLADGGKRNDYKFYLDYSIGFLTRGCFRHCSFCVNKNYNEVKRHSPLSEFVDPSRPKICLLDDNFFGCPSWKEILEDLKRSGKRFVFRQGLDVRLLTDEKCEALFESKYDGDFMFSFDNVDDAETIEARAKTIRKNYKSKSQNIKFYVLCGFDRDGKYDDKFWISDVLGTFERVFILSKYNFKPYIMRFSKYKESPLYGTYVNLAQWCNQPSIFKNHSYKDFCAKYDQEKAGGKGTSAVWRYYEELVAASDEAKKFLDIKPSTLVLDYSEW